MMLNRNKILLSSLVALLGLLNLNSSVLSETQACLRRPQLQAVEKAAANFENPNKDLEHMYRSGLLNAVAKQSFLEPDGTIYVQTGDIPAEWLRDSSAQVRPYLYFVDDKEVRDYMQKVIARQAEYITIDPYANAFKENKEVWEQKYELDSLCYPILLAWTYWRVSNDSSIFTPAFQKAMHTAFNTMKLEQDHEKNSKYTHKELTEKEKDRPVGITGMVWSGFRPSDDACRYHYLIPSEMMAVSALKGLEEIEKKVYKDEKFAAEVSTMRKEIDAGIHKYGTVTHKDFGKVFAFEVDGLGNHILLDDANIPSLLSAPYLGYVSEDDPVYQNTRKMLLSKANKNYASGKVASGIGSEHTPPGYIWPLAMIMQGITEKDQAKIQQQVKELLACDPGDHLLHESFDPDDQKKYTRPDFGWPNALFAEFIMLKFQNKKPLPLPS